MSPLFLHFLRSILVLIDHIMDCIATFLSFMQSRLTALNFVMFILHISLSIKDYQTLADEVLQVLVNYVAHRRDLFRLLKFLNVLKRDG